MEKETLVLLKNLVKAARCEVGARYEWVGASYTLAEVHRAGLYVGAIGRLVERYEEGDRRYTLLALLKVVNKVYAKIG